MRHKKMDSLPRPEPPPRRPLSLYLGLAATTASLLLLQVYLTRVFTVLFHSSFAFMAISVAFLGLGSAGVCLYLAPRLCPPRRVPRMALVLAGVIVGSFLLVVCLDRRLAAGGGALDLHRYLLRVLLAGTLMVPAYFVGGLVLARLFREHVAVVNRLYGADLTGAGAGCLLVVPLLAVVGGERSIFVIGGVAALGAAGLARAYGGRGLAGLGLLAVCLAALLAGWKRPLVPIRSYATPQSTALPARIRAKLPVGEELFAGWNALARIGVYRTHGGRSLYVRIDSSCQTSIPFFRPEALAARRREITFEALPFCLHRHARYLEIGAGGGEGMVTAYLFGARRILGVEINGITVACAQRRFAALTGMDRFFALPGVDLVVAEGRSFVRNLTERFDTVTITFIQTGAASAATAFALSEANLFTVEAFAEFMDRLTPDGLFYVYRHGGYQMLRLLSILREVYRRRGVADPRPYLFIARDRELNHAVVMAGARPFRPAEVARLCAEAKRLGVEVLFAPCGWSAGKKPNGFLAAVRRLRREGRFDAAHVAAAYRRWCHPADALPLEAAYLEAPDPDRFRDAFFLDIGATTDDRPYFFFFSLRHLGDFPLYFDTRSLAFLGGIVVLLFWLLALFTLLVVALILLPLLLRRGAALRRRGAGAVLAYFAVLGVGYIAIEISFIQRFTLFLGHPLYAISVVLMAFLVCTGVGSLLSDRAAARGWTLSRNLLLLVPVLLVYDRLLPSLFHSAALGWPVGVRIALAALLLLPLGILLGFLFPQGLRRLERLDPALIPWAWGTNSATSVLGSILALLVAIHWGFRAVLLGTAAFYLGALAVLRHPVWRRP